MNHIKKWQAEYTKNQQIRMQEDLKGRTAKGEYSAMFSMIKDAASAAKRDLDAENRRFMTVHGQVNCVAVRWLPLLTSLSSTDSRVLFI